MGNKDNVTKTYMKNSAVFADAFNFYIYQGEQVIKPDDLSELDTAESVIISDIADKINSVSKSDSAVSEQKFRDVLKSAVFMRHDDKVCVVLGIENQSDIHYAMPVRNFVYDALQYAGQVRKTALAHKNDRHSMSHAEFLSGFSKGDTLTPVVTLVVYYGAEKWNGPRSIHDMIKCNDKHFMEYVQDYRINLIEPANIEPAELDKFTTSLKKVLGYIKYSNNKQDLLSFITNNDMTVDIDAARVINAVTKTHIEIPDEAKEVDMCKAIEDLINDSKAEGMLEGRNAGRLEGINQGRLEGRADGIAIGRADGEAKIILMMYKNGFSAEQIASATSKTVDDIQAILNNGAPVLA